ncbi:MAG: acyl-CoA desaturase [Phycisphaerales bacterium]|nr:acyl-CoA desaturase [Phycisphaerales bacterium]
MSEPASPMPEISTVSRWEAFQVRFSLLLGVTLMPLFIVAAMILLWGRGFSWVDLLLVVVMYLATGFGITVGFHRYFSHKSFEAPRPVVFILGVLGSMAWQGPLFWWVAVHRSHHQHSDCEEDPHSPHAGHAGPIRGFLHAHFGWLMRPDVRPLEKYVPDLKADPVCRVVDRLFFVWALLGLAIPALLGGLLTMSWFGAMTGMFWGGLARIFIEHHATWSVNSVCHVWGSRPYACHDHSRNNPIFGVIALGEGWHNNHHAFPTSARHGLRWWQFDSSWLVIRTMRFLGLVSKVRVPSPERILRKRRAT